MPRTREKFFALFTLVIVLAFQNCSVSAPFVGPSSPTAEQRARGLSNNGEPYEGKLAFLNIDQQLTSPDLTSMEQNGLIEFVRSTDKNYCAATGQAETETLKLVQAKWQYEASQCSDTRPREVQAFWHSLMPDLAVYEGKLYQLKQESDYSHPALHCVGIWGDQEIGLQVFSNKTFPELPKYRTAEVNFFLQQLAPGVTYLRADSQDGVASYFDKSGVLTYANRNEMRFNHNPLTGEFLGLLIEGRTSNWIPHSQDPSRLNSLAWRQNVWLAPDNTETADVLRFNDLTGVSSLARVDTSAVLKVSPYTLSFFIKVESNTSGELLISWKQTGLSLSAHPALTLALDTMEVIDKSSFNRAQITPLKNNWHRVEMSVDSRRLDRSELSLRAVNATGEFSLWGLQLEARPFATSYIRTTGLSPATRGADNVDWRMGSHLNQNIGSYLFEWDVYNIVEGSDQHVFVSQYKANSIIVEKEANSTFLFFAKGRHAVDPQLIKPHVPYRSAVSFGPLAVYGSHNGGLQTNGGVQPLSPGDRFYIGRDDADPDTYLYGHIRRLTYWNRDLKPAQLVDMTSEQRLNSPTSAVVRLGKLDRSKGDPVYESTLISLESVTAGSELQVRSNIYDFNLSMTNAPQARLKTRVESLQIDTILTCTRDQ